MSDLQPDDRASHAQAANDRDRFFALALDLFCVADFTGCFRRVNPAFAELLGWTAEELCGRPFLDFVHPDDRAATIAEINSLSAGDVTVRFRNRYRCKDDSWRWLSWSAQPVVSDGLIYAVARDITALREAEESLRAKEAELLALNTNLDALVAERTCQLRASEKRFESLVEFAPDALVMTNPQGAIVLVNRQAEVLFGWPRAELVGQPVEVLMPGDSRQDHPSLRERYLHSAVPRAMGGTRSNLRAVRKDGTELFVDISLSPIASADGLLVAAAVRDVTERRQLEAQLQQSRKMESIGRLAGGIAHDFNNLLTVILGTVGLALDGLREQDPLHADMMRVYAVGERAAVLTRQLLAFSRKQIMQPKPLSLDTVVADMLGMLDRLLGADIRIVFAPSPRPGVVMADPGQVEQVIMNLVVNARDAMPGGGTLTIATAEVVLDAACAAELAVPQGPYVMVVVSDTGIGMDEATRGQIFEPFFTTKPPGQGTGLGLSTVHGIVNQSGGAIHVESEVGRGTTFKVYLPRIEGTSPAAEARSVQPASIARGGESVLVVEDDGGVRDFAVRCLKAAGYAVRAAASGEEALQVIALGAPPDVLLTDVIMPGLSGAELARQVLAARPDTTVVFTSGYTDDAIVHHGVLAEGTHFLGKPYTAGELTRVLRAAIEA